MQSRALDLETFYAEQPLNFLLFYGDYELINTIYLDDGSPLVDLSMELFNQSPTQTVKFEKPTNLAPSRANYHFSFSLEAKFTLEEPLAGWEFFVETNKSKTGNTFYFLKKEGCDLQQKPANGSPNKIVLVLKKFRAEPRGGTRTLLATMSYGPLLKNKDNQPFKNEDGDYFEYTNTIFITNNRGGKKTLPLQVDFAKGNAVLNDGTSQNSLELVIANKNWPTSNLPLSTDSQFVISFEMGADINKEGAVATEPQVKAIGITTSQSNKWDVQHVANTTVWTVKPKSGTNQLASDETIKLNITNLVTNHSSGSGYLYVRYTNIPNHPDGQFVVPIEKTPLLYRDINRQNRVGIGTISPSEKLEVAGNIKVTGAIQPSAGNTENKGIMFSQNPGGGANDAAWIRYYPRSAEDCTLEIGVSDNTNDHIALIPGGNVGIGINNPSAKLHVSGNAKVTGNAEVDGNLGIGITTPSEKLHVGGNAIVTGKVGIGTTNPSAKLHVDGGDAIVSGKVGIGTTTPSAKLHVKDGDAIVSGKLAIRTATPTTVDLAIGDNDTGLKQQGDGKLAIYTNNAERVRIDENGKVGIGTTSPQAKLDVHGDLYIKGQKPIEEREYKRESVSNQWIIETDYPYSEWLCIVGGFLGVGNYMITGFSILPDSNNGKWIIYCDLGVAFVESWTVRLLFIRRELVASK